MKSKKERCGIARCRRVAKIRVGQQGLCAGHLGLLSSVTPDLRGEAVVRSMMEAEERRKAKQRSANAGGIAKTRWTEHPKIVIDPAKASIYDNAPAGALMPWKRGLEPQAGWVWVEDLAEYDALPEVFGEGKFGWIRCVR